MIRGFQEVYAGFGGTSLYPHNKKNVIVYFYPKAATPGCTTQACGLRDYLTEFAQLDAIVVGISPDAPSRLHKFALKYDLRFDLLADEDHEIAERYGVWGLKKFMGREFMGILRTTFIINKAGKLVHLIDKVNTKTHNDEILTYMKACF